MNHRIRNILEDLEATRENLLALSDDIWLSIDHNDDDDLVRGCEFKKNYNGKMAAFDSLATELSALVQQFTEIQLQENEESGTDNESENERIIEQLNKEVPHGLDEDYTYIRPHGFILNGKGTIGVNNWKRLYELLCSQLASLNSELFKSLPNNEDHISRRGHQSFANDKSDLRVSSEIMEGLYAEVNFSANKIIKEIRTLLATFEIPEDSLQIFVREDRDAERRRESSEG